MKGLDNIMHGKEEWHTFWTLIKSSNLINKFKIQSIMIVGIIIQAKKNKKKKQTTSIDYTEVLRNANRHIYSFYILES